MSGHAETRWSRRTLLAAGGGGVALTWFGARAPAPPGELITPGLTSSATALPVGETLRIARASDQLRLRVQLVNLKRSGQRLVRMRSGATYLRIYVPAQHVDEETTTVAGSKTKMAHRVAGESRVVLSVEAPLPYTLEALLDWAQYALVLDPRANLKAGVDPQSTGLPGVDTTSFELPEGLWLSPAGGFRFASAARPVTRRGVTEEWTARLGRLTDSAAGIVTEPSTADPLIVRALWTPGYDPSENPIAKGTDPYTRPVSTQHRKHLVRAMGDTSDTSEYPAHEPAQAKRLWLGATGGWLDLEASWTGTGLVAAWNHRAVTGRDASVTVVTRGYLAPFGTPASVATLSERTFAVDSSGAAVAHLESSEYLAVSDLPVTTPRPFAPDDDRASLFSQMSASGVFAIRRGEIDSAGPIDTEVAFEPLGLDDEPLKVPYTAVDRAGASVSFESSVAFVGIEYAFETATHGVCQRVVAYLTDASSKATRDVAMSDQRIAFADEIVPGDGSTTLSADSVVFSARGPSGASPDDLRAARQPAFYPSIEVARVRDDAAEALRGQVGEPVEVIPSAGWIEHGNAAANFGATYLDHVTPTSLGFSGDANGLVAPEFSVSQFGQAIGQSVSLPSAGSSWDPASALSGLPKLFGAISLDWLLEAFTVDADLAGDVRLPRFGFAFTPSEIPGLPSELCTSFDWEPPISSVVVGGTRILCVRSDLGAEGLENPFRGPSKLSLNLERCVSLDLETAGETRDTVEFSLKNVALQFPPALPLIAVYVEEVSYSDLPDAKADFDVEIAKIALVGPLNFLDGLSSLLPDSLATFDVDILPTSVDVNLDLGLPALSFGVFRFSNLHVGIGVEIPFDDGALVTTFAVGTRANPVTITVLGIGGFASIEIEAAPHPAGLVRVEVVVGVIFEIAIDVFVAKGSLSASFSLGLEIEKVEVTNDSSGALELVDETTLFASIDLVGEIEVLGLITITVELLLALEYRVNQRLLIGEATVSVEVDAGVVKKEASFTVSQEFQLGDGANARLAGRGPESSGLAFADRYEAIDRWSTYCAAYA